jgi:hypothetical protein
LSPKLSAKYFGPFPIVAAVGTHAFKLELPESVNIHPVFHVSQLKPFVPSTVEAVPTPPPLYADRRGGIFVVEAILGKRKYRGRWQYLVKWDGYDESENTWEPSSSLQHLVRELAEELAAAPLVS